MYIFGGQDDENNKLNDLWEFDIETETFTQIELPDDSYQPSPRSGHSSTIHKGCMYIFGGILELTKELNELLCFDFATRKFKLIGNQAVFEDENDIGFSATHKPAENDSPGIKGQSMSSPMKGQNRKSMYPSANFSPNKKSLKAKPKISPSKKKESEKQESGLVSPTSI